MVKQIINPGIPLVLGVLLGVCPRIALASIQTAECFKVNCPLCSSMMYKTARVCSRVHLSLGNGFLLQSIIISVLWAAQGLVPGVPSRHTERADVPHRQPVPGAPGPARRTPARPPSTPTLRWPRRLAPRQRRLHRFGVLEVLLPFPIEVLTAKEPNSTPQTTPTATVTRVPG